jgi:hypothetical protein
MKGKNLLIDQFEKRRLGKSREKIEIRKEIIEKRFQNLANRRNGVDNLSKIESMNAMHQKYHDFSR